MSEKSGVSNTSLPSVHRLQEDIRPGGNNMLNKSGINPQYVDMLEELKIGRMSEVKLFNDHCRIKSGKGICQGGTILLNLFNVVLEIPSNDLD